MSLKLRYQWLSHLKVYTTVEATASCAATKICELTEKVERLQQLCYKLQAENERLKQQNQVLHAAYFKDLKNYE